MPFAVSLVVAFPGLAPAKHEVTVRHKTQEIYHYEPAASPEANPAAVLFLPGDGGWRGFALTIAENLAGAGYHVYGWDTKRYLSSFTDQRALTEAEVAGDVQQVIAWISDRRPKKVTLIGWSEGAALALLAVARPGAATTTTGLVAIGMPESGVLGWRWFDTLRSLANGSPNEPRFTTTPYLGQVTPLPMAMIYSNHDQYMTAEQSRRLFAAAQDPKRLFLVEARNHRFDGNQRDFFHALREALQWIAALTP